MGIIKILPKENRHEMGKSLCVCVWPEFNNLFGQALMLSRYEYSMRLNHNHDQHIRPWMESVDLFYILFNVACQMKRQAAVKREIQF